MLISRVPEDRGAGEAREAVCTREPHDHSQEYQTANELFELMAKNHAFDTNDSTLSTSDLVILYKNIDLGTRLLSTSNELKRPNQHVETVVYNDDADSDSDLGELYSTDNLHDVFQINKERIDLLNTPSSLENTLCHKLGDLELQTPDFATDYDKHFLFKDPYIKEQLKNLKFMSDSKEFHNTVLPSSLLDYICCKRLEDNYNFYMENVIRYVKHTIEQLKRISNGDYLTEKAKQKWREVERYPDKAESNKKILATSTSIPLHVERKVFPGRTSMWDDLVHSEVDIRSLSKILENKIFLEVPKIICGSYRLFSRRCADNLVISCKRATSFEAKEEKQKKSRVDVVVKLERSDSGHVVSNINSIMILQTSPNNLHESILPSIHPLPTLETELTVNKNEESVKIVELDDQKYDTAKACSSIGNECFDFDTTSNSESNLATNEVNETSSEFEYTSSVPANTRNQDTGESNVSFQDIVNSNVTDTLSQNKTTFNHIITPDELRLTMCKLNIQTSLPEESSEDLQYQANKKKSLTRVRIKSPYENKSYVMEDKKRKRLLEIRERREKKKMAMSESCRIVKHKYGGRGAMMPQPSSSVTKLSISNKSFYNSIYGHNDNQQQKAKKNKRAPVLDISERFSGEEMNVSLQTPDRNSNKYINRSFYLDDTVTEIRRMQMKKESIDKELCSASTSSAISADLGPNFSILSQLISRTDMECKDNSLIIECDTNDELENTFPNVHNGEEYSKYVSGPQGADNVVPVNTPKDVERDHEMDLKNVASTKECRKSIDKIYELMKKVVKTDISEKKKSKIKSINSEDIDATSTCRDSSTGQASDSGTSLKHHRTLSDDSGFSFQKTCQPEPSVTNSVTNEVTTMVIPKVIISTKSQTQKTDPEKYKKYRKKVIINSPKTMSDNPLKAISNLLHEFDNVQKTRQKGPDAKPTKNMEAVITDGRNSLRQRAYLRKSRIDQQVTNCEQISPKNVNIVATKDKKYTAPADTPKIPHQQISTPEKSNDKYPKKKVSDIIDEAKEARGEAVRGPSKTSRLNTLAQPKRSYVQAHSEEFQNKYGRNLMTDRLQRLAGTPQPPLALEKGSAFSNWRRLRRAGPEVVSSIPVKQPPRSTSPLEKGRLRSSTSSSPEGYKRPPPPESPCKANHVGDSPEILKNKMVAVESYVKLHYGRVSPVAAPPTADPQVVHKTRIPLIPTDLELSSITSSPTEESTALGSKLHKLIDSMFNSISPALDVLSECPETYSKLSNEESLGDQFSKDNGQASVDFDDHVEIFEPRNVNTALKNCEKFTSKIDFEDVGNKYDLKLFNSVTEMHRLEDALQRQVSLGSFQKRLRIKKLTLSPKESMHQVVVLQSGDANSLILKASLSQNIKVNVESCSKNTSYSNDFTLLTNSHLDWNFTKIPMQIATVGYTFPNYQRVTETLGKRTNSVLKSTKNEDNLPTNLKLDKTSQCFKGRQANSKIENTDQVEASSNIPKKFNKKSIIISEEQINKPKPVDNKSDHLSAGNIESCTIKPVDTLECTTINEKSDDIEYTNSLDMLVALLNEIQKVTTCQMPPSSDSGETHRKQLETILNNASTLETVMNEPRELISITSLDKLRQLDSNPSIYSFFSSNGNERKSRENQTCMTPPLLSTAKKMLNDKPLYADKEISVDILDNFKLYTNMFTDVPSQLFPVTVNHSTNITNSLIEVVTKPSTQSYKNIHNSYSNCSFNLQKIIELSYVDRTKFNNSLDSFEVHEKPNDDNDKNNYFSSLKVADSIEKKPIEICNLKLSKSILEPKYVAKADKDHPFDIEEKLSDINDKFNVIAPLKIADKIKTESKEICTPKLRKSASEVKHHITEEDKDSIMKIKRDVLVTLYSVLVFTVFAALSFPELVYHA